MLLGVVAMIAHACVNRSLKLAPASVVVPYQYSTIFWAILLGFIFFGDVPGPAMLLGAGIIIAAGIYIFIRERTLAKPVTDGRSAVTVLSPQAGRGQLTSPSSSAPSP